MGVFVPDESPRPPGKTRLYTSTLVTEKPLSNPAAASDLASGHAGSWGISLMPDLSAADLLACAARQTVGHISSQPLGKVGPWRISMSISTQCIVRPSQHKASGMAWPVAGKQKNCHPAPIKDAAPLHDNRSQRAHLKGLL